MTPEEIALYRHALTFRLVDLAPFDALLAEVERLKRERDAALSYNVDRLAKALNEIDQLRAKAAALDAIEQYCTEWRDAWRRSVRVFKTERNGWSCTVHGNARPGKGPTPAAAIMAAIEKAKGNQPEHSAPDSKETK